MIERLRSVIRRFVPKSVRARRAETRTLRAVIERAAGNQGRSSAEVFGEIYRTNAWGGEAGNYFSGTGSIGRAADAYVQAVNGFITKQGISSVVDIGCGDYRIGQKIACDRYVGIDVVDALIERNREQFASDSVDFTCLDAATAPELPSGELCLVRQVLQHLSNAQILAILPKLRQFRFVLVTEHYPSDADFRQPNADLVHGQDTRLSFGSGVYLDQPPFNQRTELLLECSDDDAASDVYRSGSIRCYLVTIT